MVLNFASAGADNLDVCVSPEEQLPIGRTRDAPAQQSLSRDRVAVQWDALLRQIGNSLPAMIWICGADGRATLFNRHWLQFTGCAHQQALAGGWIAAIHPDDAARRVAAQQAAMETHAPFETEYRLRRADGEYRWILDQGAPQFDTKGAFHGFVGVAMDITERRNSVDKLRWLFQAVEQNPAIIVITDLNANIEYVNPKFTEVTGYTSAEVLGKNSRLLKSGETTAAEYRQLWATIANGEWRGEFHNRKKNGELYWEAARIGPIRDEHGRPTHYIAIKEDITERKRIESALHAAEERFRIAVENAELYVYDVDAHTGISTHYGPNTYLAHVRTLQEWMLAIHPDDRERVLAAHARRRESGQGFHEEYRVVERDGSVRHVSDHGAPERDGRWVGVMRDITARKQADDALARLAAIVQCSPDTIVSSDLDGIIRTWNPAAEKQYGYTAAETIGLPLSVLRPPGLRDELEQHVANILRGDLDIFETWHARRDGSTFPVSVVASPIRDAAGNVVGNSGIIRDITEERRAQTALRESENRLRAIFENSSDIIWLIDPAGVIVYESPGVLELPAAPEPRLGTLGFEWIHPDDQGYIRRMHEELLREPGSRLRAQIRLRRGETWRWVDSWAVNLLEEPGVHALAISFRDITELKDAETALRDSEQRYRKLVEDASDTIFTIDLAGNLTSVNSSGERVSGYSRQELLGMNVRQLAAPEDVVRVRRAIENRFRGGNANPLEAELLARDGSRVSVEVSGRLQFKNGAPAGMQCIARDVSQRKRTERLEQNRREVLEMVAQNRELEAVLCRLEAMVEQYYPGSTARIELSGDLAFEDFPPPRPSPAPEQCRGHLKVPILACDGADLGSLALCRPDPWEAAESEQVLLDSLAKLASIALEHRQLTDRLAHQAQHDPLTGLPNRTLLDDRLRQAIGLARRQNSMLAVLYVDLDHFKYINDTLGHPVGDLLLKEAAKRMEGAVRESDTLARMGGDEFVAVLYGVENIRDAQAAGERILDILREPFHVRGHELFSTASVGMSIFPRDGQDAATLQKHADLAMYEAKNRGRNRFQSFAPALNTASHERLEIENQLHRALDRGELVLHYQPQFELPSRRMAGVEALLRWEHPKWGLLPPGRFIPVAEESGLIIPISLWVLQQACRQHQLWRLAGYAPVRVAVNISATQFLRSNLAEKVAQILAAHHMEPGYLELELTEGVLMRDAADSARQLAELRALGVLISIDDFGTGYSSLSYLQRLPIDDLKIDKCFVESIHRADGTETLVEAIIGLAHGLHVTATAEGVEDEEELAALCALGCDRVQGFLLARPEPADYWNAQWLAGRPGAPPRIATDLCEPRPAA